MWSSIKKSRDFVEKLGLIIYFDYLLWVPVSIGEQCRHVEHDFSPLVVGIH